MSAIHVVVRPEPARAPSAALAPLYGLFDVVVDGVNITARLGEGQAFAFLAELAHAVAALTSGQRERAAVQLHADSAAWELGLERDGDDVLLSVYRAGPEPEVAVHERRAALGALRDALLAALNESSRGPSPSAVRGALLAAQRVLVAHWPAVARPGLVKSSVEVAPKPVAGLAIQARVALRTPRDPQSAPPELERSDLHALLARGELKLALRGRQLTFTSHPFLLAERLLLLAEEVVDACRNGRHVFRRSELEGVRFAVRRGPRDAGILLSMSPSAGGEGATFPEIPPQAFVQACARFASGLGSAIARKDPAQTKNLRLTALLSLAQTLAEQAD